MTDRLLVYYDDLRRLAESKCASREEAEDLVSETFLAAYAYIRRGGVIEYPKTYLANTLMHKRNSLLRKAYRRPPVVSLIRWRLYRRILSTKALTKMRRSCAEGFFICPRRPEKFLSVIISTGIRLRTSPNRSVSLRVPSKAAFRRGGKRSRKDG